MSEIKQPASALSSPRFCNMGTFMRMQKVDTAEGLDFAIAGAPFDTGSSFRSGSRFGPNAIRNISAMMKPNNVIMQVNIMESLKGGDIGDFNITPGYIHPSYDAIEKGVAGILEKNACPKVDVTIQYTGGEQQVILNKENVNGVIRKEEVGNMASATSVYPVVRTKLVELQRQLAAKENVIMDGRDIGTVVLPDANVKIYLTASSKVRAKRRFDELTAKGVSCDMDAIEKDIIERDYRDMHRETSPLKQAEDAVLLDSSDLDIDGVVEEMKKIIKKAE